MLGLSLPLLARPEATLRFTCLLLQSLARPPASDRAHLPPAPAEEQQPHCDTHRDTAHLRGLFAITAAPLVSLVFLSGTRVLVLVVMYPRYFCDTRGVRVCPVSSPRGSPSEAI